LDNIILVAQGDPDDMALIRRAIGEAGVVSEIITVCDGEKALDYLFARGSYAGRDVRVQPQLVLLDLALPRIGGLELLHRLRQDEHTRLLRVVTVSSSDQPPDVTEAYKAGANSYIHKPTDPAQFAEAIRRTIVYWLTVNEPPPEGRIERRGSGDIFRGAWFRAPMMDHRKLRRATALVGVGALLIASRRGRHRMKTWRRLRQRAA
jgi:two-component system response regulator